VEDADDFLVAGRRLPLPLASATLFATWFGAGTMLTAADEVRAEGLAATALEPLGAGVCLLIAGAFFARRLWEMRLLTFSDFFARRFGKRAEIASACIMIPGYFGWIAVQFLALAGMLELFFGIPLNVGVAVVALVGMGYTLLGGMWAVTLTDALQLVLLLTGLVVLGGNVLEQLGQGDPVKGLARLDNEVHPDKLRLVPTETLSSFVGWLGVLLVSALGNLPGQDLLQRIFSARSGRTAAGACWIAGIAYVGFGAIPVLLGISARVLFPDDLERAIVPALARAFMEPTLAVLFVLALASAVLSTIDSAILSPSSVMAQNLFPYLGLRRYSALSLNRVAVVLVTAVSLTVAYVGEDAYGILELAYEIGLVGLFVPLAVAIYRRPQGEMPALASMIAGTAVWLVHLVLGWEHFLSPLFGGIPVPVSLPAVGIALLVYLGFDRAPPHVPREGR
jgi:Na+/proline symporter